MEGDFDSVVLIGCSAVLENCTMKAYEHNPTCRGTWQDYFSWLISSSETKQYDGETYQLLQNMWLAMQYLLCRSVRLTPTDQEKKRGVELCEVRAGTIADQMLSRNG